jgi:hypothetical protein
MYIMLSTSGFSIMTAGGFTCSLQVLHGGLELNILQFLFYTVKLDHFWSGKPWIRIRIETKADPQHGILPEGAESRLLLLQAYGQSK